MRRLSTHSRRANSRATASHKRSRGATSHRQVHGSATHPDGRGNHSRQKLRRRVRDNRHSRGESEFVIEDGDLNEAAPAGDCHGVRDNDREANTSSAANERPSSGAAADGGDRHGDAVVEERESTTELGEELNSGDREIGGVVPENNRRPNDEPVAERCDDREDHNGVDAPEENDDDDDVVDNGRDAADDGEDIPEESCANGFDDGADVVNGGGDIVEDSGGDVADNGGGAANNRRDVSDDGGDIPNDERRDDTKENREVFPESPFETREATRNSDSEHRGPGREDVERLTRGGGFAADDREERREYDRTDEYVTIGHKDLDLQYQQDEKEVYVRVTRMAVDVETGAVEREFFTHTLCFVEELEGNDEAMLSNASPSPGKVCRCRIPFKDHRKTERTYKRCSCPTPTFTYVGSCIVWRILLRTRGVS